jgi:hypothetical protein
VGWLGKAPKVVVSLDVTDLSALALQQVLELRRRVKKLTRFVVRKYCRRGPTRARLPPDEPRVRRSVGPRARSETRQLRNVESGKLVCELEPVLAYPSLSFGGIGMTLAMCSDAVITREASSGRETQSRPSALDSLALSG